MGTEKPGLDPVNIIVIGYTVNEQIRQMEEACLDSVRNHTVYPYVLTYFNNYQSGMSLTKVWNRLIKSSSCKYICLLNSDTIVYPGWLYKLVETINTDEKYGFVGPSTDNCHGVQCSLKKYEITQRPEYARQVRVMMNPICGFCLLFKKDTFTKLRGFDERFDLYGQESDLLNRALKSGYACAWRKDAFVHHIGEATMKAAQVDVAYERKKARGRYAQTVNGRVTHRKKEPKPATKPLARVPGSRKPPDSPPLRRKPIPPLPRYR